MDTDPRKGSVYLVYDLRGQRNSRHSTVLRRRSLSTGVMAMRVSTVFGIEMTGCNTVLTYYPQISPKKFSTLYTGARNLLGIFELWYLLKLVYYILLCYRAKNE